MAVPSIALLAISVLQVLVTGALGLGWGPFEAHGMHGVAAGQLVAYAIGAVALCAYLQSGRAGIRLQLRGARLQRELLRDILKVGAVACVSPLQTVLTILILTRLVAQFGTQALAGYGIGAGKVPRARRVAWSAAAMAAGLLGGIGLVLTLQPDLWTRLFTQDQAVLAAAASYFHWAGPCYALFGLGLSLYFSSLGSGKVAGPVLAGTLRLVVVAVGGVMLADRKSTRLNSSHNSESRMPSSA
jgi:Na+-driven multidrug efflux pump